MVEIAGKLGLRFPPANAVDREAHAARVALLAEDCADIDPELFDRAASEWSKRERFFPKACEMRDLADAISRITRVDRLLPKPREPERPYQPPLSDEEIARLPAWIVSLGISVGEITRERANALRDSDGPRMAETNEDSARGEAGPARAEGIAQNNATNSAE